MKIGLVGPTYPFRGGIAHYTTLLHRALQAEHEVLFISWWRQYPSWLFPGRSDLDPSRQPLEAQNVERTIDSLNPWTWLRAARRLIDFQPDLVIFQWWVVFWAPHFWLISWVLRRNSRAKILFLCHNAVEHESSRLKRRITRFVLRRADRILSHAEAESRELRRLLGEGAVIATAFHPTYAELGAEDSQPPSPRAARQKLGLTEPSEHGPERKILLFFGFVRPYKGLDVLLEAMPSILRGADATLLVVGEIWRDKEPYLEAIERLGLAEHIRLVDRYVPNEEIATYFAAADLVVQPYRSASGSGICQLAYGHGRPVVATRVGSLAEVVEDGVNGRLVEPEDPAALAAAVLESLEPDRLESLSAAARTTRERFSWSRLVSTLAGEGPAGATREGEATGPANV